MDRQHQNKGSRVAWKAIALFVLIAAFFPVAYGQELNGRDTTIAVTVDTLSREAVRDSVVNLKPGKDSLVVKTRKKGSDKVHSPKKATIYSAVMPGLGQIYNRKYWKVPLVYIGFASLIYAIDWNNDYYTRYRQAYIDISDDDPTSNSFKDLDIEGHWNFDNPAQVEQFKTRLENAKESTRRYRDLCIIGTAAFYAINIIDASVDAHFFNFDISDDLTMNWMPQPMYAMNQPLMGVSFVVNF